MFIRVNNKPYFYNKELGIIHPVKLTATTLRVNFDVAKKYNEKITSYYTQEEITRIFGIFLVDGWSEKQQKVVKITNKVVSTLEEDGFVDTKTLTSTKQVIETKVEETSVVETKSVELDASETTQTQETKVEETI